MAVATREFVRRRANDTCEYCQLRQERSELTHHIEHIVAKQHGGTDEVGNLALACQRCNLCKGPNLTGIDTLTGEVVPLFHPRRDQ
jgi:5-methylcytosine-specific restriction endonuclease McrA